MKNGWSKIDFAKCELWKIVTSSSSSPTSFTFKKEERLSSKKRIDELFENGSSFYLSPLRILWLEKKLDVEAHAQVLISVSKKNFKRAVDRNKIKRLIREAYRLNKHTLYASLKRNNRQFVIGLLYTSKIVEPFSLIQQRVIAALNRLVAENELAEKHSA